MSPVENSLLQQAQAKLLLLQDVVRGFGTTLLAHTNMLGLNKRNKMTERGWLQDVVRGLGITERTAVLAAAVSIDFD